MKDTIYKDYLLTTKLIGGINISRLGGVVILHTCNTLNEAVIWIDETIKANDREKKTNN